MSIEDNDLSDLVPDRVPDWLVERVQNAGRNPDDFGLLDQFYRETDAVKSDRFDRDLYHKTRNEVDDLDKLAISRWEDDPSWFDMVQDEFLGLYKARPEIRDESEMKPSHKLNWAAYNRATDQREWEEMRTYTELDKWAAAMAAVEFGHKLQDLFDELKELSGHQKNVQEQEALIAGLLEQLKDAEGNEGKTDALLDKLQKQLDGYGNAIEDLERQLQKDANKLRQGVKAAAKAAKQEVEDVNDLIESFGTEAGTLQRMSGQERIQLAQRIARNKKLKELAEKVGRFIRLALGEQARKITHASDEVYDIEMGDNLNRILPSELVMLDDPDLDVAFLAKYIERGLLQYQLRGTEKIARGAIICMIDTSGSMQGSKEVWAKAVALALLNIAHRQRRNFVGILFGSAHDKLLEWKFDKGIAAPKDVLDFAEFNYFGGTDFMKPLTRAMEILEQEYNTEKAQKGDLVFITDGECAVTDQWRDEHLKKKAQLAARTYSCLIGVHSPVLEVLSDQIYHISDLAQGNDVKDIFGAV